jgi:hypothetical protein
MSRSLVDTPDLDKDQENTIRADLLSYRGYKQDKYLFAKFPHHVDWRTALLDIADLRSVRVMNQEPWVQFSGGSRIAWDVAQNFISGKITHDVKNDISDTLQQLRKGIPLSEIILVAQPLEENLVVLEGHVRLMALLMSEGEIEAVGIIGTSPHISQWRHF